MRINFLIAFLFAGFQLASLNLCADEIPTEGVWKDGKTRTCLPDPPTAYIESSVLSIHLAAALSDLTITVTDENGVIVFEECISTYEDNVTHSIQMGLANGEYHLTLTHYYGTLQGEFALD
jgi:hypothetical protein